jgi:hypothetical protein
MVIGVKKDEKRFTYKPLGHCASIFPFRDATVVAGLYLLGPMSVPSASLNLSSIKSSLAIDESPTEEKKKKKNPTQILITRIRDS